MNQALSFGLLFVGGIALTKAVTGSSFADIVKGHPGTVSTTGQNLLNNGVAGVGQTASNLASPSTDGPIPAVSGNVPTLPEGTALTGGAAELWATAILTALGAPTSQANLRSMLAWFQHEGGGGQNNPMNTTLNAAGATGSINSAGVKGYSTPAAGVAATVKTLEGGYPSITAALRGGEGLSGNAPGVSGELSTWSGGGYSSL